MAQKHSSSGIPHEDRTAAEPREEGLHDVVLHKIEDVNESIKLYKLRIKNEQQGVKVSLAFISVMDLDSSMIGAPGNLNSNFD